jgi:hypothetical protein
MTSNPDTTSPTATLDQSVVSPNGSSTIGVNPNVVSPNGPNTSGLTLNGVGPLGVASNGSPLSISYTAPPLAGVNIIGSTWTAHLSSGGSMTLRIDAAMSGLGLARDLWAYQFSAWSGGAWQPLCVDATGNPTYADSVTGTWNMQQGVAGGGAYNAVANDFTLACRGSSIAKCVELGYEPWNGNARELAACVRALRADYCGDGTSYTVSGTLVNLYDDAGIEPDNEPWTVEAAWTPDGAACITAAQNTRFSQVAHQTPSCLGTTLKAQASCGSGFTCNVRIITELPSP